MNSRYLYLKFIGFLLTVFGFSYSLTSLYNLYDYLFGYRIINHASTFIMSLGILLPLYMLVYGLYFYLYTDRDITKMNKIIMISSIDLIIAGLFVIVFKIDFVHNTLFTVAQIFEFLHVSMGYITTILGAISLHACIKYKL